MKKLFPTGGSSSSHSGGDSSSTKRKRRTKDKRDRRKKSGATADARNAQYRHLLPSRISVLGSRGTGKTSLMLSFIRQRWHPDYDGQDMEGEEVVGEGEEEGEETVEDTFSDNDRPSRMNSFGGLSDMAMDSVLSSEGDTTTAEMHSPTDAISRIAGSVHSTSNGHVIKGGDDNNNSSSRSASAVQSPLPLNGEISARTSTAGEDNELDSIFRDSQPNNSKSTLGKLIKKGQKLQQVQSTWTLSENEHASPTPLMEDQRHEASPISSSSSSTVAATEAAPGDANAALKDMDGTKIDIKSDDQQRSKEQPSAPIALSDEDNTANKDTSASPIEPTTAGSEDRYDRDNRPSSPIEERQTSVDNTTAIPLRNHSTDNIEDDETVTYSENITEASSEMTDSTYDSSLQHLQRLQELEDENGQAGRAKENLNPRMSIVGLQALSFFNESPQFKRPMTPHSPGESENMFTRQQVDKTASNAIISQPNDTNGNGYHQVEESAEGVTSMDDHEDDKEVEDAEDNAPSKQPPAPFDEYLKKLPPAYTLMEGIRRFNQDDVKKAVRYMVSYDLLEVHPTVIARFLATTASLKKSKVGDYLGRAENEPVLKAYCDYHNQTVLRKKSFIDAIRTFLTQFNLPAEGQMVTRIAEQFALSYVRTHPDMVVRDGDSVTLLACALLMLNTDLHHPMVKNKMTCEQFHAILSGHDIPAEFINEMYNEIRDHPMLVEDDIEEEGTVDDTLHPESFPANGAHKEKKKKGLFDTLKRKKKKKKERLNMAQVMMGTPETPVSSSSSASSLALSHSSSAETLAQPRIFYKTKAFVSSRIYNVSIKDTDNWLDLRHLAENIGSMDEEIMKNDLFICTYSVSDLESFVMIQSLIDRILKLKNRKAQSHSRHRSPTRQSSSPLSQDNKSNVPGSNSDRRRTRRSLGGFERKSMASAPDMQPVDPNTSRRRTLSFFSTPRRHHLSDASGSLTGSGLMSSSSDQGVVDENAIKFLDDYGDDNNRGMKNSEHVAEEDLTAGLGDNNILLAALNVDIPEDQRVVSFEDGANFALKKGVPFFEVSTVLNRNVRELFDMSFEFLMDMQNKAEKKLLEEGKKSRSKKRADEKDNNKKKPATIEELFSMPKTYI